MMEYRSQSSKSHECWLYDTIISFWQDMSYISLLDYEETFNISVLKDSNAKSAER